MKKKIGCLFMVTILIFTLTACGGNSDNSNANSTDDQQADNTEPLEDKTTDGEKEAKTTPVTIYHLDLTSTSLQKTEDTIETDEALTIDDIWTKLQEYSVVSNTSAVNDFKEDTDDDGSKVYTLDLPASFTDDLADMDKEQEENIIQAIVNTLLENFDGESITITIDGEVLTTANASYDEPIEFKELEDETETDESDEQEEDAEIGDTNEEAGTTSIDEAEESAE